MTRTAAYDGRGRISQKFIADTVSLDYTYSNGRLHTVTRTAYSDEGTETSQTIRFGYDIFGNSTDEAKVTYTYDDQSQLTQAAVAGGPTYRYSYDTAGNIQLINNSDKGSGNTLLSSSRATGKQ